MKTSTTTKSESFSDRLAAEALKPTEHRILDAALTLLIQKGFNGHTINQIAELAQVTEPTIYNYFNGKEDLLFRVVERQGHHAVQFRDEQMQGITGAYNKLRKLIWVHLRYNDLHREYITIILLECRSNLNYYSSQAYQIFRHYAGTYLSILKQGIDESVFREDLDPRLVRDLILGLLDFEAYTTLITREIEAAAPDHDDIMYLLDRIILKRPSTPVEPNQKKIRILEAAIQVFSETDYARATMAEIARRANVSEGTVYEYYKNKEDLLLAIPEERFVMHLNELSERFADSDSPKKLERFIRKHFRLYVEDPHFLVIFVMMILLNRRFYETRAYQSLKNYIQAFEKIVDEGIENGSFTTRCNVRVFRNLFWGAFIHMCLRWFIIDKNAHGDKLFEIGKITGYLLQAVTMDRKTAE